MDIIHLTNELFIQISLQMLLNRTFKILILFFYVCIYALETNDKFHK